MKEEELNKIVEEERKKNLGKDENQDDPEVLLKMFSQNEYSKDEGKLTIRKPIKDINEFFKTHCKDKGKKLPFETKELVLDVLQDEKEEGKQFKRKPKAKKTVIDEDDPFAILEE